MGRRAATEAKAAIIRVRVTESLEAKIKKAYEEYEYQGTVDNFTAFLAALGLKIVELEVAQRSSIVIDAAGRSGGGASELKGKTEAAG